MGTHTALVRQCALMAALVAVVAVLSPPAARIWVAAAGVVSLAVFVAVSLSRHRQIQKLTVQIDEVLHNGRTVRFEKCHEGDVAVLTNELEKMVSRLARATELLQKERSGLADSLADVSHQIRTPLTAAELMLAAVEREEDPRERKRLLRRLEGQMERISWLVTTLLKIAKVDAGAIRVQHAPVNVASCAARAASPLETALDLRDVALRFDIPAAAQFTGDELWTAEAVENILKNCMENTPAGGSITVVATKPHWPPLCASATLVLASPPTTFPISSTASTAAGMLQQRSAESPTMPNPASAQQPPRASASGCLWPKHWSAPKEERCKRPIVPTAVPSSPSPSQSLWCRTK